MTSSRFGTARKVGDTHVLRYERRLAHPLEAVWDAITERDRLADWLAAADELELRAGGSVTLRWLNVPDDVGEWEAQGVELEGADPAASVHGTITRLDPPRLLEYDTDTMGLIRFELRADGNGTMLIFTNEIVLPEAFPAEQTLAGWHSHLDALERALAGKPTDWPRWTRDHLEEWKQLRDRYAGAAEEPA
ncbi:MAG: SRPBCC family protein [Solirubrobacteraceae bacterium]